jgi:serine/threonine protein kinase
MHCRLSIVTQMEYCKTTMRDMIDESKLTTEMVWKFLRQILEALAYIHGEKVIHRSVFSGQYYHNPPKAHI